MSCSRDQNYNVGEHTSRDLRKGGLAAKFRDENGANVHDISLSLSLQNEGKNANVSGLETAELNNMPPHIACFLNMSDKISSHLFSFWCTLAFSVVEVIEFASRACWQARHTRQKTIKLNSQTLCGSNLCLKGSVNPTTHCLQSSQEFHATSYGEICSAE